MVVSLTGAATWTRDMLSCLTTVPGPLLSDTAHGPRSDPQLKALYGQVMGKTTEMALIQEAAAFLGTRSTGEGRRSKAKEEQGLAVVSLL